MKVMPTYRVNHLCALMLTMLLSATSCGDMEMTPEDQSYKYLFLSHTRLDDNSGMIKVAEDIDYSKFDLLLLGGDLALNTSANTEIMANLDAKLDFRSEQTLWTLGNHDYSNLDLINDFTGRPTFYRYHQLGITYIVFDTQKSNSNITPDQLELFKAVTDTISQSSHLVVLTHKLIWLDDEGPLSTMIDSISNGEFGTCGYCLNPNNFYEEVYSQLEEVQNRGIQVFCIAGDAGSKVSYFEYLSDEGVQFIASGISHKKQDNMVMVLYHNYTTSKLNWDFVSIEDL